MPEPVILDDIAGGLTIEYFGLTDYETLDQEGNVVPFVVLSVCSKCGMFDIFAF